jgi:acetylornithine/N-succinyldiaminopimelate aminotransferase
MMCIQLDSFDQVEKVSKLCAAEGLVIDWFLHCETALRLAPPLIITEQEIRKASNIILKALNQIG